ncbi:MAG: nucleotidyltransferase domain-containing protein [Armatimonadetes bacterium]|nr:nucleotidyltransferase domain-containing protein [Armatimonadota bacterium]
MNAVDQVDIQTAARILQEAGATEVFVFGSAAHGELRPDSDIDLAVRGLAPEKFFRAMSEVTFAVSRPLDLVDLDESNPFTEYLVEEGELRRVA